MSQNAQITFVPQVAPEGLCPQNFQEILNSVAAFLTGYLPGTFSSFNIGPDQPTVDNQDKPWIKTNADGTLVGIYTFGSGAWVRPHPIPAGPNGYRIIWSDSTANLALFEGGDAGVISATTGAFWEVDTNLTDHIPVGAGTTAVNVNASTLTAGTSNPTQVRGVYFAKRSIRQFYVA